MFEQIDAINRAGVTILMVEQNARRALALSDRGYVLDLGRNRSRGRAPACSTTRGWRSFILDDQTRKIASMTPGRAPASDD